MSHEVFDRKVDGMICPQCEDEIAHRLLHTRGILSCTASYRKSTVTADFDPDILSAEGIERILAATGYPVGDGRSGRRADAIALVQESMAFIAAYEGEIPGASRIECGNYLLHDLAGAKQLAASMIPVLEGWKEENLIYEK